MTFVNHLIIFANKYNTMDIERKEENQICGIYSIENILNNRVYVGSSKCIYKRILDHRSDLRKNKHSNYKLQHDWNIYGEEYFHFNILCSCNLDQRTEKEQYYMDELKPFYNIERIIYPIMTPSKERKEKISQTLKKRYKSKEIDIVNRKKINVFDLEGNLVFTFNSLKEVCDNLKIGWSSLYRCLIGKHKKIRQYQFRYENSNIPVTKIETYDNLITKRKQNKGYSIKVVNINTNEILNFISMKEASNYFNLKDSESIRQIMKSKNKLYKKQWLFKFL